MEVTSNVELKGEDWDLINDKMVGYVFKRVYDAYRLAIAIGIKRDKVLDVEGENTANIPRTVLINNTEELSYFFKTAILTTNTISLSSDDRAYLAFSEELEDTEVDEDEKELLKEGVSEEALKFNKFSFLRRFANYGAREIASLYDGTDVILMQRIKDYLEELYKE